MKADYRIKGPLLALAAASACFATAAHAHISLEAGGTHLSRLGEDATKIKEGPCGLWGSTRGTNIYEYRPGETIHIALVETIPHPSYFRIAFDDDGDDGFEEPQSILPIDPNRPCPINSGDKCGASDFDNNSTVLLDNQFAHASAAFNTPYAFDVTLPNVTCENCTLQVIQVMEDNAFHGDFNPCDPNHETCDPVDSPYVPDIYHQCIDLVLNANATGTGGAGNGGGTGSAGYPGAAGSNDSGGCSMGAAGGARGASAPGSALLLLGIAGVLARARRRRR